MRAGLRGRPGSAAGLGELAELVQRLAVLLAAGVAPSRAWRHAARPPLEAAAALAEVPPTRIPEALVGFAGSPVAGDARSAGARGAAARTRPEPALAAAWRGLAASWAVAEVVGAPLADTLRGTAAALRGLAAAEREVRIALAGPRATARLVTVLPLVAAAFGAMLGQDALGVLFGTPFGWGCAAVGAVLMLVGRWWTRRMLRSAERTGALPGLVAELTAIAMSGGVSVERARRIVTQAAARFGLEADPAAADATLELAASSGAPAAELLRAEAAEARAAAVAEAREHAERLSVRFLLPLGVCVLPAFVAVGVLPLMASIVGGTLAGI